MLKPTCIPGHDSRHVQKSSSPPDNDWWYRVNDQAYKFNEMKLLYMGFTSERNKLNHQMVLPALHLLVALITLLKLKIIWKDSHYFRFSFGTIINCFICKMLSIDVTLYEDAYIYKQKNTNLKKIVCYSSCKFKLLWWLDILILPVFLLLSIWFSFFRLLFKLLKALNLKCLNFTCI